MKRTLRDARVDDIAEVTAMTAQFIAERPLPVEESSGAFEAGSEEVGSSLNRNWQFAPAVVASKPQFASCG